MNDITISVEIRIEAGSESEARKYAAAHGIDTTRAHWQRNPGSQEGRLYVTDSSPLGYCPVFQKCRTGSDQ